MARKPDLADLTRRFAAIPKEVRAKIKPAIEQGGAELVARMKYLAPADDGQLRETIAASPGPVELSVTVSAGGENALYQEYGTANMHRNSFFWPSVNTLKKRVKGRIDRAISKAVREGWK